MKRGSKLCSHALSRSTLNRSSKKNSDLDRHYAKINKAFQARHKGQFCPIALAVYGEFLPIEETHHQAGRESWLKVYEPFFLGVSRKGHKWATDNAAKAIELGFSIRLTADEAHRLKTEFLDANPKIREIVKR
jgi:hypothetical protein